MTADMGRGTSDDSKTWHQYGAPAVHVSNSLAAAAAAERLHAVFLFGDLSYAQGCVCCLSLSLSPSVCVCVCVVGGSLTGGKVATGRDERL
jgi:hypothetical protein